MRKCVSWFEACGFNEVTVILKLSDNPPSLSSEVFDLNELQGDWWVAHTKSRAEKALAWDLLEHSVPYFLPMVRKNMLWGGRRRTLLLPLFASYIFVCGSPEDRYKTLRTNRVCQMIPVTQRQQFLAELNAIRYAIESDAPIQLYPYAAVGRRCRVAKGALRGIEGIVAQTRTGTRLMLQVSMLGQSASLEIFAEDLEPLD